MRGRMFTVTEFCCAVMLLLSTINLHGQGTLTYLHTLIGVDGQQPIGGLVFDSAGNLYGTTRFGGASSMSCPLLDSCGTVFELSPDGSNGWTYQVLYSFTGASDGAAPSGDLVVDGMGNIYGTTLFGGIENSANCTNQGCGTVFELSQSFGKWQLTTLHSFNGLDGSNPWSGVTRDRAGRLYGTTNSVGTIFVLVPSKSGWKFSTLLSGGGYPYGGLALDASGNLYGTISQGGNLSCNNRYGCGAVFELSRSGGVTKTTVLHIFNGYTNKDGAMPMGNLLIDNAGDLYGTTQWGGSANTNCPQMGCGTVFKLSHSTGTWKELILHRFNGSDGNSPTGDLAMDSAGNLYGTTSGGGTECSQCGTVFTLKPSGTSWQFQTLYDFSTTVAGGWTPMSGITLDGAGNLFGTTAFSQPFGTYGTIFELEP